MWNKKEVNFLDREEIWRPVVRFEGWYEVSNLCRVRRVKPSSGARVGYILKTFIDRGGYPVVYLSKNGKVKEICVHILMLEAFVGPRPEGCECNHKNGDLLDNRIENLEWVTHKENVQHAHRVLGKHRGENHCNAKLTEKKVLRIRELHETGKYTQKELGKMSGCSDVNVGSIVRRRTWKHI